MIPVAKNATERCLENARFTDKSMTASSPITDVSNDLVHKIPLGLAGRLREDLHSYQFWFLGYKMSGRHIGINRELWNTTAREWVSAGERSWKLTEPIWGIWGTPESELGILPTRMVGMTAIELGCGTGYVASWMAKRGARVTGIDVSSEQLLTAQRLAKQYHTEIVFYECNAEEVDAPDEFFDYAISEYGAAIWCDPELWLREAWRILRPGGALAFVGHHPLTIACMPEDAEVVGKCLQRSYRDLRIVDWSQTATGGIEFNRSVSNWIRLFNEIGFSVLDYREIYAPSDARGVKFGIPADWAKKYPSEQVWKLQKSPKGL